jgi:hypothetical protein
VHCSGGEITLWTPGDRSPNRDLVISVDETKELERETAEIIISELGHAAHAYYEATQLMCTVLVTSLVWKNF